MKMFKQLAAALVLALIMVSCSKLKGEGPVVSETRDVSPFSGLVIKVPAKTILVQGPEYKVELLAQRNILDEISTIRTGTDLEVHFRKHSTNIRSQDEPVIRITMPFIDKAEIHGSGSLSASARVDAEMIDLLCNGSAEIEFSDLRATDLFARTNGSGRIRVRGGAVEKEMLEISGSGDIEVQDLLAKQAQIQVSGSGKVLVNASEQLRVSISGSGKVKYRGNPVVNSNVSGSGSVGRL